jgi:hypothetical protein
MMAERTRTRGMRIRRLGTTRTMARRITPRSTYEDQKYIGKKKRARRMTIRRMTTRRMRS